MSVDRAPGLSPAQIREFSQQSRQVFESRARRRAPVLDLKSLTQINSVDADIEEHHEQGGVVTPEVREYLVELNASHPLKIKSRKIINS